MKQLKEEREAAQKQLSAIEAAIVAFGKVYLGGKPARKRRKLSGAARAKIAAAQSRRWAKVRAAKKKAA